MNQVRSEQVNRSGSGQVGYWQIKKKCILFQSLCSINYFFCVNGSHLFAWALWEDILREEADP